MYTHPGSDSHKHNHLWGWIDADYAACKDTRKSHTGYVLMLNGAAISWKSKRHASWLRESAQAHPLRNQGHDGRCSDEEPGLSFFQDTQRHHTRRLIAALPHQLDLGIVDSNVRHMKTGVTCTEARDQHVRRRGSYCLRQKGQAMTKGDN